MGLSGAVLAWRGCSFVVVAHKPVPGLAWGGSFAVAHLVPDPYMLRPHPELLLRGGYFSWVWLCSNAQFPFLPAQPTTYGDYSEPIPKPTRTDGIRRRNETAVLPRAFYSFAHISCFPAHFSSFSRVSPICAHFPHLLVCSPFARLSPLCAFGISPARLFLSGAPFNVLREFPFYANFALARLLFPGAFSSFARRCARFPSSASFGHRNAPDQPDRENRPTGALLPSRKNPILDDM